MKRNIFLLNCVFFMLFIGENLYASMPINYNSFYKTEQTKAQQTKKRGTVNNSFSPLNRTFELTITIVSENPNTKTTELQIQEAIDGMNDYFKPMGISFYINKKFYDPDFKAFTGFSSDDAPDSGKGKLKKELESRYYEPHTINIYYLPELAGDEAGFAVMPTVGADNSKLKQYIYIDQKSASDANVLAHEMGHLFGLFHPFEKWNTSQGELADGSNCQTNGDLVCDTPAEPDFSQGSMISNCEYTGLERDAANEYLIPSVTNIMSYGNKDCICGFTKGQFIRMSNIYKQFLSHLR